MYRIYIFLLVSSTIIMTENSKQEISSSESFNNSIFLIEAQKKTNTDSSSFSISYQQSYEQKVSEKSEQNQRSHSQLQALQQSKPFSVVLSQIAPRDQSQNLTQSIHYHNARLQESDFLPQNLTNLQRIKELQEEVEALKAENKELKSNNRKAGAQSVASFESMNAQNEEQSGAVQSDHVETIDYKSKYIQYKTKCKYLMKKLADLQAIMSKKK